MRLTFFLLHVLLFFPWPTSGQEVNRPIYSLTIFKNVNNEGTHKRTYIEVDSVGNITVDNKKNGTSFKMGTLRKELNDFVINENVEKYPGSNDIIFIEPPTAELNKQSVVFSVTFFDDIKNERNLRNKTYYSWGASYDKDNNEYPIFKYLSKEKIKLIKEALK